MTPEELEFARTFTDKEVMSSAISQLRARTINEYYETTDESKRQELEKRQLLLEFEARAVLGDDDIAHSIQHTGQGDQPLWSDAEAAQWCGVM